MSDFAVYQGAAVSLHVENHEAVVDRGDQVVAVGRSAPRRKMYAGFYAFATTSRTSTSPNVTPSGVGALRTISAAAFASSSVSNAMRDNPPVPSSDRVQ